MTEVVSGLIVRDRRALLTQRRSTQDFPLTWETPGGKVESAESRHDALRRELREELGIVVGALPERPLWFGPVERPGREQVYCVLYLVEHYNGFPAAREGQGIGWFKADEIPHLDLPPGNKAALISLQRAIREVLPSRS